MTAMAAEGLPLPSTLQRLVGDSAEDMARNILRLHKNETVNEKARIAGLALIERENSKKRVIEAMAGVLPRTD